MANIERRSDVAELLLSDGLTEVHGDSPWQVALTSRVMLQLCHRHLKGFSHGPENLRKAGSTRVSYLGLLAAGAIATERPHDEFTRSQDRSLVALPEELGYLIRTRLFDELPVFSPAGAQDVEDKTGLEPSWS